MIWNGRSFPEFARKMFSLRPLALQEVHPKDSVLARYANRDGTGLKTQVTYPRLIREAFQDRWWKSEQLTPDGFTQMEANFTLFWGLAINMYESTLVSDQTPFDHFADGDREALSEEARRGLKIFLNEGRCINCHEGPEFTGATVSALRGARSNEPDFIEFMDLQLGPTAFYDNGFYNIGVRPTLEDLGVGASHPQFGPLSYTRQRQNGRDVGQDIDVPGGARVAVDGAFKTPTLRNIELTGPYMHNGGMKSLTEVVQFYTRRADFFKQNIDDLDPDVDGISRLQDNPEDIAAVVAFLKSLTDERVRHQKAPFDHPEITIPHGHSGVSDGVALDESFTLPAVGRNGGPPIQTFEEKLEN
jgi:cytochrome c peroxidase